MKVSRRFFLQFVFSLLFVANKNQLFSKSQSRIENIINLQNYSESDFYSSDVYENIIYIPIYSKHTILAIDLSTSKIINIDLPLKSTPDTILYNQEYGIFIGCANSTPPLLIKNPQSNQIESRFLFEESSSFYATSIKASSSGKKVFIGNLIGNPIIFLNDQIYKMNNLFLSEFGCYDAVWITENNLLISSVTGNKVYLVNFNDSEFKIIKEYSVSKPYRFSPIIENVIALTTMSSNVVLFNIEKDNIPNIKKIINIPKSTHIKSFLPRRILEKIGISKYEGYLNDVAWIDRQTLAINTRTGNSIIILDINGKILEIIRAKDLVPTRFAGSRLPNDQIIFTSKSNNNQINTLHFQ